jgi:HD-like signal output (HDOD) protein
VEKKIKILFVDDEVLVLQGLQRLWRPLRGEWQAEFVESGRQALERMAQEKFDILISDMAMPEMNGAELLNEVQRRHPETIRVILSGHADPALIARCLGSAHQFLAKPCDPQALRCIINRAGALREGRVDESIRHAIAQLQSLPAMPGLYSSMVESLRSPDSGVEEVARLISRDIGMTGNILRLVNSAFFGMPQRISSVSGAVSYLGLDTIKNLVLSLEVFAQFEKRHLGHLAVAQLWEHSLQTAGYARALVKKAGHPRSMGDDAFAAGILHDAGKLILATHAPAMYDRVLAESRQQRIPSWQCEASIFGTDHAEVAGYLFGLWGLPSSIVDAITYHHRPSYPRPDQTDLCSTLHISDILANRNHGELTVILDTVFLKQAGLPTTLPELIAQLGDLSSD